MQDLKNDRLFVAGRGLIFQCMKKALFQLPNPRELYALNKRARRSHARHVASLLSILDRAHAVLTEKVVRYA